MAVRTFAVVCSCLLLNICLSVLIVLLNKWIYTHHSFPNLTMTWIHFVCSTVCVSICHKCDLFYRKALPFRQMLPLSLTFCGFVALTNLSLQMNTIGTYQLFKMLTTPLVVLIQILFYNRHFPYTVLLTLVPIMFGVFLNLYSDIKFNPIGTVFAMFGIGVTSLYQVWVSEKQLELQANSMQLLYYQAPLAATILMPIIPFFEPLFDNQGLFGVWSYEALIMVALSGFAAFGVNLSIFWIIGNTSPLTYNVVGHTKFCLTLLVGYVVFSEQLSRLQVLGVFLAFVGSVAYTSLVGKEAISRRAYRRSV